MSLTMSELSAPAFERGLTILATLLEKGEAHADEHDIAPASLLEARLIADMLPLSAQVQRASDTAKFALQRIGGGEAPRFADDETTFAQLRQRIADTISYVRSVDPATLDAGATRAVTVKWGAGSTEFTGASYLLKFALPNFYFHIVTAHDILRQQGVKIGKLDYLGPF
jgi:hypothetical protein